MAPLPGPGDPAPSFHLPSPDGRIYRLQDFAGRPLVLTFIRHPG